MANIENKNYLVGLTVDDVAAQPITGRWFKAGLACFWGSCLALMFYGPSARPVTSEATNLIGVSPFRRILSPSSGSMKPAVMNAMGRLPGSSPFKQIALSAIEANNIGNRVRDVSMMVSTQELKDEMANLDGESKAEVAKLEETVAMQAKNMPGVTGPLGFFDPLGFSTDCSEGKLLFYREVELKHGRVAMLASLGILVAEQFHPLFGGNINVPSYIAFQQTPLQSFWPAVMIAIAIPESTSVKTFDEPDNTNEKLWTIQPGKRFGFDPLGLKPQDPKEWKEMQTKELNNGRLAMIAAAGMIAQEVATGRKLF